MKYLKSLVLTFLCIGSFSIFAQSPVIDKIEPPNWWVGMSLDTIQLMIYGENLSSDLSAISNDDAIEIIEIKKNSSDYYAFVYVRITDSAKHGEYQLTIKNQHGEEEVTYPILERPTSDGKYQGFDQTDVVYLLMPDRFCDGDTTNNIVDAYPPDYEYGNMWKRQGGDIQGIINKLDYLKDLGFNTLWLNPVLENNTNLSYHGYAATDLYNVDKRLGDNELYKKLVQELHKRDMKIIWDHVANHIGIYHKWVEHLPDENWFNGTMEEHLPAYHQKHIMSDPYSDPYMKKKLYEGWFVDEMPDLNQKHELLADYLIQNMIWWMEYAGIDGIREDTYPYADQKFLADFNKAILDEYPTSNIVGEIWTGNPIFLAWYQTNSLFTREFDSHLPAILDFAICDEFHRYFSGKSGMHQIYDIIAADGIYADPTNLMTFLDNHDFPRGMYLAKRDTDKMKIAQTILLTSRGIPQLLYGTEIGMDGGPTNEDCRHPFPGGFPQDSMDAFTQEGRNEYQNEIFNYLKQLLHLRKKYPALETGELTQYPPRDNYYFYFKEQGSERVLVTVNDNIDAGKVDLGFAKNKLQTPQKLQNLFTGDIIELSPDMLLPQKGRSAAIWLILE